MWHLGAAGRHHSRVKAKAAKEMSMAAHASEGREGGGCLDAQSAYASLVKSPPLSRCAACSSFLLGIDDAMPAQ